MFEKEDLQRIAKQQMPFGKYKGRVLIELPEEYLLWFARRGFPGGQLGELMQLILEIKVNGLEYLIGRPGKPMTRDNGKDSKNANRKKIRFD